MAEAAAAAACCTSKEECEGMQGSEERSREGIELCARHVGQWWRARSSSGCSNLQPGPWGFPCMARQQSASCKACCFLQAVLSARRASCQAWFLQGVLPAFERMQLVYFYQCAIIASADGSLHIGLYVDACVGLCGLAWNSLLPVRVVRAPNSAELHATRCVLLCTECTCSSIFRFCVECLFVTGLS